VKIPWPLPPAVDRSTRRVGRSRAAARGCGLETRYDGEGRAPPRSRSTAARPSIDGRAHRREGPRRHRLPPHRSSIDERGRLDPLGYDSVEEPLDCGASTHWRACPPARRPATAPSPGELRSAAGCGVTARREKAQMNPSVHVRAPKPVLFGRNPRVAVRCRWTAHV
jgi:hypothetical protein